MIEEIRPIYSGDPANFHWVGFGSGSGTNLRECAKAVKPYLIFSDKPSAKLFSLEELAQERGISHAAIDGYRYCGSWKKAQGNPQAEAEYMQRSLEFNHQIVETLKMFEEQQEAPFDLIVLGGYMRLVREPLIKAYRDKIINVHPADLAILDYILHRQSDFSAETRHMILNLAHNAGIDVTGSPMTRSCPVEADRRFVGEDAVYDAIKAGRLSTRSSVIMVDEYIDPSTGKSKADHGEILTQGADTYVDSGFLALSPQDRLQDLRSYVDGTKDTQGHQARQKERSDWPALTTALRLIADGRLALGTEKRFFGEWRNVYLKDDQGQWKPLPYEGLQVGER